MTPARPRLARSRSGFAGAAAGLLLLACVGDGPAPAGDRAPAPLVASQEMPGDFVLQQRLAFRWSGGRGTFDAAVQSACGELTIILLTPFGTPDTVIRQRGLQVDVTGRRAQALPFAPEHILLDVQRSYAVLFPGPAPRDGSRHRDLGEEHVEEIWRDGKLVERVFHPSQDGAVRIHYSGGAPPGEPGSVVSIESERFGYHLDVTTLSRTVVRCADGSRDAPGGANARTTPSSDARKETNR